MRKSRSLTLTVIGLLGIASALGCMKSSPPLSAGAAMPPIQAEGWLNGQAVTSAELQGKVIVIECFAYW